MTILGIVMAENLYSPEQKTYTEQVNYDLIFRDLDKKWDRPEEPHRIVDKRCWCSPSDCNCEME